jgi:hypothetical protein
MFFKLLLCIDEHAKIPTLRELTFEEGEKELTTIIQEVINSAKKKRNHRTARGGVRLIN